MSTGERSRRVDRPTAAEVRLLHVATLLVFVAAVVGLLPGPLGTAGAVGAVTVAIVAPVLRVGWLAVRWARRGDAHFAICAAGLVLVVLSGSVVALSAE